MRMTLKFSVLMLLATTLLSGCIWWDGGGRGGGHGERGGEFRGERGGDHGGDHGGERGGEHDERR